MKLRFPLLRFLALLSFVIGLLTAVRAQEIDAVAEGKAVFESMGCIVCHVVSPEDDSLKTGPPLTDLFLTNPREREVEVVATKERRKVKADKDYFLNAVRKSWDELAISEHGDNKGEAFPAAMPYYAKEIIGDRDLEHIWHYLRTLAPADQRGPAKVMVKPEKEKVARNWLEIPDEVLVTTRTRVFRAPLRESSSRAIHVGQTNGMSYTFDPQRLSLRRVWSGGFLNMKSERSGRGKPPSALGQGSRVFLDKEPVLAPFAGDEPVHFGFKEPDVLNHGMIEGYVWGDKDFAERLAAVDAEFLGHELAPDTGVPTFRFRVGANTVAETITIGDDGRIEIDLRRSGSGGLRFQVREAGLGEAAVEGGSLADGVWTIPADAPETCRFTARIDNAGLVARPVLGRGESWAPQAVASEAGSPGKQELRIPAGYAVETWTPPLDLHGRKQLFEPTGIAVAKDGTIVVATRAAGVWRVRGNQWSLFAEGTYECLGVWIEDGGGDRVVVAQKPELTRMVDSDGDGRADRFETVCDDYGFHGNYHEYTHGPVRDAAGNYYFTLNLSHGGNERVSWRAGGPFMGSMGGYRGWACRVTPGGEFEPFARGLRSPAGLGIDPDGRLWYAENQGEYVGSSKVIPLEKDAFYGHLSGLISLPGMKPDSEALKFEHWRDRIRKGAVWLPHGKLANSPGHPAWDTTGGRFGPFAGQMFIGDQTLSKLLRVVTEQVKGQDQGCVIPFGHGLASGVMRPCFLPDGSLLVGQTGRGWGSRGGQQGCLQRIVWDGKTVPGDFKSVRAASDGFVIQLTRPAAADLAAEELAGLVKARSWFYTNTSRYGSPEHERRDIAVAAASLSGDRSQLRLRLDGFGEGDNWLDRIYHLRCDQLRKLFGDAPAWEAQEAYFTLRAIP